MRTVLDRHQRLLENLLVHFSTPQNDVSVIQNQYTDLAIQGDDCRLKHILTSFTKVITTVLPRNKHLQ